MQVNIRRIFEEHTVALVAVSLLILVLATAVVLGATGRRATSTPTQLTVNTTPWDQAYRELLASGARGRTVVLFDLHGDISERDYGLRSKSASDVGLPSEPVDATNIASALIRAGVARRVFVMLPADDWRQLRDGFGQQWGVFPVGPRLMRRMNGAPVVFGDAGAPLDLRGEKALVIIKNSARASFPSDVIDRWTNPEAADVVVSAGIK